MENEFNRMQKLAGVPVTKTKKQLDENFVGMPMVGNIFDRPKADYELAYEHYLGKLHENDVEEVSMDGGRSIPEIQDEWIKVTTEIAKLAAQYQGPKPDMQVALDLGDQLKAKARIKQQLEKEITDIIAGNDRDTRLSITQLNEEEGADGEENPIDSITMDVPLFIRMLEFAREDASTDMDLHDVAEKATAMSAEGEILSMDNYEDIVGGEAIEEGILSNIFNKLKGKNAPEEIKKEKFDGLTDEEAQKLYDFSKAQLDVLEKDRQSGRPDDGMYSQLGSMHHDNLDKLKAKYPNLK